MMHKLKLLVQEADSGECNMTAEGSTCPVHGMDECEGYMEEMAPAGISDSLAAKKIAAKIMGTPDLNIPKIKQYVTKYLSMVGKAPTDVDHLAALVATELENKGVMEAKKAKPDFLDVDGDGNKKEPMKKALKDKAKKVDESDEEDLEESINITLDGPEAEEMLNRLASLAGVAAPHDTDSDAMHDEMHDEMHPHAAMVEPEVCDGCGSPDCDCAEIAAMENADHDHGHVVHSDEGEPVDPDTYMWRARSAPGTQGFVKGGDNPLLIKEDANALYAKLAKDYKTYVAEADLARSNTGTDSPLTATDRDDFEKDPFAGDEPVTDGTRSPLSTIKRQKVSK